MTEPEAGPWPAFADLFAASTLLFLILFAALTIPAVNRTRQEAAKANTLKLLQAALASDTGKGYHLVPYDDHLLVRIPDKATFPQGQYELSEMRPAGREILHSVASRLGSNGLSGKVYRIGVVGHTSSEGGDDRNWRLSAQRAVTVAMYLIQEERLPSCEVSAEGRGEYYPVDPAAARARPKDQGMAQDRRIELEIWPVVPGDSNKVKNRLDCVDRNRPGA